MSIGIRRSLALWALVGCASLATTAKADITPLERELPTLRIPFVENRGQHDAKVAYSADTFAGSVFVTRDGQLVHSFPASRDDATSRGWTLVESFESSRPLAPSASQPTSSRVSRFIGSDESQWKRGLRTFGRVELGEAWEGIDVAVQAHGNNVEKLFTVNPGADVSHIRVRLAGAESLRIGTDGSLIASTPDGEIAFTRPIAFQEQDGSRRNVEVAYAIDDGVYGFELGAHDPARTVVIDPLIQSTYLGPVNPSIGGNSLQGLAIHPVSGDVYVVSSTASGVFPGTAGGAQPTASPLKNWIVARLSADLKQLLQSTYLGGNDDEDAWDVVVHPWTGEVLVIGSTRSYNFPGTTGGAQSTPMTGTIDFAVARLSADLTQLLQSTYLGGIGVDVGTGLAVSPTTGVVFAVGFSESPDFPGTTGGAVANLGGRNCVVARLNSALTVLRQSTYGPEAVDYCNDVAIHPQSNEVYVLGGGYSGGGETGMPFHHDAYVGRFNSELTQLVQDLYLGVSGFNVAEGIAIHPASGDIYVAGWTGSSDFPGTSGGAQPDGHGESRDGFVARLSADLSTLLQSTYLGTLSDEAAVDLVIDSGSDEVLVAGYTKNADFPGTDGGAQQNMGGSEDMFVTRLGADLKSIRQSTYLGGRGNDEPFSLAIHPASGEVYVFGYSLSPDFPATAGGAQSSKTGTCDGGGCTETDLAIARLSADLTGADTRPDAFTFTDQVNVPRAVVRVSNSIEVAGIEAPARIRVTGGEYSVNGGTFRTFVGMVAAGDHVRVRHTSSAGYSTAVDTTLNIGGVLDTWTTTTLAFADSDGDGMADDTDTDDDNDRLPDAQDPNPLNPDGDGDGIPDGQDVEFVQDLLKKIPLDAFRQPKQGNRNAAMTALEQIEALIAAGNKAGAITKLQDLRKRMDGCGARAQKDDWILDCGAQLQVRALIDLMIANLRA